MINLNVEGTCGDAFTVCLKLWAIDNEEIKIFHKTVHTQFYPQIRDIYGLKKNIEVAFVDNFNDREEYLELSGVPYKNNPDSMVWFPDLKLPYVSILDYPYIVICPHAGREDAMARSVPIKTIEYMIEEVSPIKCILLGTNSTYKGIKNCENLIGETNVIEAMSIISDCNGFCGPEGLLCFVALSQLIPSVIFWVRWQPIEARVIGTPWQEHIIDLIKI